MLIVREAADEYRILQRLKEEVGRGPFSTVKYDRTGADRGGYRPAGLEQD